MTFSHILPLACRKSLDCGAFLPFLMFRRGLTDGNALYVSDVCLRTISMKESVRNRKHIKETINMKKLFLLALSLWGVTVCVEAQQTKEKVAVYVSGDVSAGYKKIISVKAVSRISRSESFAAVERTDAFLDVLTKEQDYQLSGEVRDDQIAELGRRFGARYVAVLEATETDGTGFISARMIDVEGGLIIKSADTSRKIESAEDWAAVANNVAFRLVSKNSK